MATTIVTKSGSGAPAASDLVAGELAVDLTNKRLYTEDGSAAIIELGTNPSGNVTFGDNGKAIFGAGSDLQIYHDGSNSYIEDTDTGSLFLKTNGAGVYLYSGSEALATFNLNGANNFYYDNGLTLSTTASGIDVTGSVTTSAGGTFTTAAGNDLNIVYPSGRSLFIKEGSETHVAVDNVGNVGIGTSAPQTSLAIETSGTQDVVSPIVTGQSSSVTYGGLYTVRDGAGDQRGLALKVYTANVGLNEAMRIDSSGDVGIGVVPEAWTAFNPVLRIKNASTGGGGTLAGSGVDNFRMFANTYYDGAYKRLDTGFATQYGQESGAHVWSTAVTGAGASTITWSESMRIDTSGNLLVGGKAGLTDTGVGHAFGGGSNAGLTYHTADDAICMSLNRLTSDGDILRFVKDGTAVGTIGSSGGVPYFAGPNSSAGGFRIDSTGTNGVIIPTTNTGANRDAAIDLGYSSGGTNIRFRDLYLSSGVYLGGTSAAHKLDYYEEGTFSPEIYYQNATDQAAATDVIQTGTYTKVGNIVNVSFRLEWTAGTGLAADNIGIKNLPFVGASNHYNSVGTFFGSYTGSDSVSLGNISAGGSLSLVLDAGNSGNLGPTFGTGTGRYIRGSMTYLAA